MERVAVAVAARRDIGELRIVGDDVDRFAGRVEQADQTQLAAEIEAQMIRAGLLLVVGDENGPAAGRRRSSTARSGAWPPP